MTLVQYKKIRTSVSRWRYLIAGVVAFFAAPFLQTIPFAFDHYLFFLYVCAPASFFAALVSIAALSAMETFKRTYLIVSAAGGSVFGLVYGAATGMEHAVTALRFPLGGAVIAILLHVLVFVLLKPSRVTTAP